MAPPEADEGDGPPAPDVPFAQGVQRPSISASGPLLFAAWIALGALLLFQAGPPRVLSFAFVITGWVLAVVLHEFGHAVVAYWAGDHTVVEKGYFSLNPLKYANVTTSIVLPVLILAFGGIGFPGGAVYLRQDLMRGPWWRSAASLAGPAGTLLALLLLTGVLAVLPRAAPGAEALSRAIAFLAFLQATALILNLLPVPGLDGYGVLRPLLPSWVRSVLRPLEAFLFLGLILIIFMSKAANALLFHTAFAIVHALGVSPEAIVGGLKDFQFWR